MGRPAKTLKQRVEDGSFLARRPEQRALLAGPALPWPLPASLQARYRAATSEPERHAIALEFERFVRQAHEEARRRDCESSRRTADALALELAGLGRPGSAKQLLGFFPAYLAHSKGPLIGQPFRLAPFQQRFLREFYRRDKHGRRVYRNGVFSVSRGCGKTPLAAGLGLYELLTRRDAPEVYCAAASKDQAGITLGFARAFVEHGPLDDWVGRKSKLLCPATGGVLQVVSSEGTLQHGRAPSVAILDELWAFETARQCQTYTALASALHKREDAFLLSITTAGYDRHSLLGRIYDAALAWPQVEERESGYLRVCKDEENGSLLWWHGAPDGAAIDDPAVWRKANPASWINTGELRRQLNDPGLSENEFRRLSLNQWTTSREAWLPNGCWETMRSEHKIPKGADVYVGVDIGISHDATALCWAHMLEDGRIIVRSKVWSADLTAPAHTHVSGGRIELEQIEQFIVDRLAARFRVREVAYDPHFFQRSAELLAKRGLTMVEFRPSSAPMYEAYQAFFQLACEARLTHNGDPVLAAHINATTGEKTSRGWRLSKLKNTSRIDGTVAACLAVARARHHKTPAPTIRWLEP